jgi:polyisoprenoid-binding protein YceI
MRVPQPTRVRPTDVDGLIVIAAVPESCSVQASIATASIDTGTRMRDDDLRSAGFLDSTRFPTMRFASTEVSGAGPGITLVGDLTIRDVTRRVVVDAEFGVGASSVEGSKGVVGDTVGVELDIQACLA